jgi:PmbA protein
VRDLDKIAALVVDRALPGENLEVFVARGHDTEVRVFKGEIESLSSATSEGVGVRVVSGNGGSGNGGSGNGDSGNGGSGNGGSGGARLGFAWAGSLDDDVVASTLEEARDNARFTTPDPFMKLATKDGVSAVELDLFDPGLSNVAIDEKIALALDLERRVRSADPRIRQVTSADYGDASVEVVLASTAGIRAASRRTSAYLSVSAIAGDSDESETGSGFSVGRGFDDLDPARAGEEAVCRATRMLGAVKGGSKRCTVVFDPRVSSTLLSVLAEALSGEAVVKGRSFLAGRLGESVACPSVTLVDDPTDARAFGASPYDGEGLASRRNELIVSGVLAGFVYDTVSAARAGVASTGSAVRAGFAGTPSAGCRAVLMEPGASDQAGILAAVGSGLYVQSITGVHSGVSPVSGDFSVGVEGLMIRDGELAEPVREMTVASTLPKMLLSVLHVGNDVEWLPGNAAGQTLAVSDMQVGGD